MIRLVEWIWKPLASAAGVDPDPGRAVFSWAGAALVGIFISHECRSLCVFKYGALRGSYSEAEGSPPGIAGGTGLCTDRLK